MLFINSVMETKTKGEKPTADWLWDNASSLGNAQFPQMSDGARKLRPVFSCTSLPMNMAVDLTTMKIVYSSCGYSASKIDTFIKSHFGL